MDGVKEKVTVEEDFCNFERTLEGVGVMELAWKPVRYLLERQQIWIDIGYDLEFDSFLLGYLGINLNRMRELEVSEEIFRHKVVDTSTRDIMRK